MNGNPLLIAAVCATALVSGARADTRDSSDGREGGLGKYQTIVERAPFRSQVGDAGAAVPGSPASAFRLNGIVRIGSRLSAGFEDTAQNRSLILAVGEKKDGIELQSIDEKKQTATIVRNGEAMFLAIEKAPVQPIAPPAAVQIANAQPLPQQPGYQNVSPNPGGDKQPKRRRIIIPRGQ